MFSKISIFLDVHAADPALVLDHVSEPTIS